MIYYRFKTKTGYFHILQRQDGWAPMYQDEELGRRYPSAQHALDDLAGGAVHWPSCGDPSRFGLPSAIEDWEFERTT